MGKGWGYRNRASKEDILKRGLSKRLDNDKMKVYTYDNYNYFEDWVDIKIIYNKIEKTKTLILFNKYLKPFREDITNNKNLGDIVYYILDTALNNYVSSKNYKDNVEIIQV